MTCLFYVLLTSFFQNKTAPSNRAQDPNVTFLKNVGESVAAFLGPLGKQLLASV